MTKKVGLALAAFAAVALIGAGSYAFACSGTCSSKDAKKASNTTQTTSGVQAVNADMASSSDKSTCASTCSSSDAKKASMSGVDCSQFCSDKSSKNSKAVMTSNGAECTPAQKAACEAAGYSCTTTSSGKASCTSSSSNAVMTSNSGAGCDASKASMTSAGCFSKDASKASMASGSCASTCGSKGAKASWAGNVYKVENGVKYAVADGKKFVVTDKTPYKEVGNARYYFADESCSVKCSEKMKSMTSKYNHEAAMLASNESNVKVVDGKKMASCCGQEFAVDASTPVMVMDGQKVYCCSDKCAEHKLGTL